jgi:hypothetical protein
MGLKMLSAAGRAWGVAVGTVLLAGCGGGVVFSIGGSSDTPNVSLVANIREAAPGAAVRLAAAASSERRIQQVIFFQLDDGSATVQLGSDASAPFEWIAVVPAGASTRVRYLARAFDDLGRFGDSDVVTVTVR